MTSRRRHGVPRAVAVSTVGLLMRVVGRRNMVRVARFVALEARLESSNDIETNGEQIIQRAVAMERVPVVLDVGAHYGEWALSLLRHCPHAHLFSFEPSAYSYRVLTARLPVAPAVRAVHAGLSDEPGVATLYVVGPGAGVNSVVKFADEHRTSATEKVTLTTLDLFCAENAIGKVTLLKVDAEGHDLAVLRGAADLFANDRVEMVQFEYNHRWIDARLFLLDAFEFLVPYGFIIGKITRKGVEFYDGWHAELETFREANFIACNASWASRLPRIRWWNS